MRGPEGDPRWSRPALLVLLAGSAVLYLWNLSASGWANDFYAAAVEAGTQSWKAWLFGSLDSGNAITVDKPPAALWVMVASARIFGFSSWSLLVPQALMGVASVGLLYATVRRWAGPLAGLLAGATLALTPAAVLMFRFDNPDALLVLLLVAAAWAVTRAVDAGTVKASSWWLVVAGSAIGFAFLTKMGQALLVVPALGLVHLVAGAPRLRIRSAQLLGALAAMVVSAGWFVALVELWPTDSRPYVGGSTTNSLLELALGYNGLGRLLGGSGNGGGGAAGAGNTGFGGSAGIARLFTGEIAYEVSWLLPAALILLAAGLWVTRRAPRTDRTRAGLLLWGGWMLVTGLVLSSMSGTMHPYYTVALAPGIAGVLVVGAGALWQRRASGWARATLALAAVATGVWTFALFAAGSEAFTWLRWPVAALALAGAVALVAGGTGRRVLLVGVTAAVLAGLAGTSAYAVATASAAHTGSIPSVGTTSSAFGSSGAGGSGGFGGTGGPGGMGGGPVGGASAELTALLGSTDSTWSAAVPASQTAAALELASGTAVMSTGGWGGSDSAVTPAQFQQYVAEGRIHYYVGGGRGSGPGGSDSTSSQIAAWVAANFTAATTVGGQTVYDLTT
ncbi:glycosyltransferase family 39 protein [Pseudonocardia kujensis]|uniref:ArnT family glycosyltransferase n=1 Tax=Pseudonocardia kujensis TaxID=1128675 RepID=UPI001E623EEF|nr:glycosyltransferase family 39 protein [Pseudonocardia kujensis]MCE0766593.1 glycosyltransferase family 39 protein [Pseudonocardia kujensis]